MGEDYSDEHVLNHISWMVVQTADRWWRPDETAQESIEAQDLDGRAAAHEEGYHVGAFLMMEELADMIHQYDDVFERARAHAADSDLDPNTDWDVEDYWREHPTFGPIEVDEDV